MKKPCFPLLFLLLNLVPLLLVPSGAETFSRSKFPLPPHFVFGSGTSAYQVTTTSNSSLCVLCRSFSFPNFKTRKRSSRLWWILAYVSYYVHDNSLRARHWRMEGLRAFGTLLLTLVSFLYPIICMTHAVFCGSSRRNACKCNTIH